ncbi:MAG: hypothetical protein H7281_06060 [Bacteriovorax sp.]|nr:hypothetical protein [Bacteriovorax sp.]
MHNFSLLIILILFSQAVCAEVLKQVEIFGNKRTKKEAIIQHGRIKIGKELSEEDLQTVKENLGRIGQIHVKNVDFKDGTLKIEVEDKWTLFPVPMITQSGSYQNRGFLIYDDNFLGSIGTLAPGISWSNSILNYLLYYQDESLFNPQYGIKVLLLKKSEFVEFKRLDNVVDDHESRYNSYLVTPNYLYKEQVFKAGPVYIDKSIYKKDKRIFRDISKGIFFRHHWNAFQALEVMYEGFVTTYDLYALKNQTGKMVYLNEANISWSIPTNKSFLNYGLHAYHSNEKSYLFAKNLGGDEGFRGYDKASFPTSENIGGLVQYQQHLFHRFFLSPFYEYNNSKLIEPVQNGRRLSESTVGIGLRYYFKKISIPAVIFDAARNIDDNSNHFHINIGVSI